MSLKKKRDGIKRDLELAFLIILMPEHASVLLIDVKVAADFSDCISTAWRIIIILELNIPFLAMAPVLPSLVCLSEQKRSCKVTFDSVHNQGIFSVVYSSQLRQTSSEIFWKLNSQIIFFPLL